MMQEWNNTDERVQDKQSFSQSQMFENFGLCKVINFVLCNITHIYGQWDNNSYAHTHTHKKQYEKGKQRF